MPPINPLGLLVGAARGGGGVNPVDMLTNAIPGGGPAVDMAKVAIQGAANALMPASPETEARFAQLMAGWSAVELRVTSLPTDGSIRDARSILDAYKAWTRFRNDWLQGRKDGAQLPAQEGALQRVAAALDATPAAKGMPPLGQPSPRAPRIAPRRPSGPSKATLAVGAVALVGTAVAATLMLRGK